MLPGQLSTSASQKPSAPCLITSTISQPPIHSLALVDELVARTFRVPCSALHAATRSRKSIAYARQIAMYLDHVCLSYPLRDVADHFRRDRTTVAYACRVIEDRREEEEVELLLNSLESALATMQLVIPMNNVRK